MKFKHISSKRRGLSSIVGALLFVVLMVSAFAVIGVALDSQTDIASTGRDVAAKDLEKQKEEFTITSIQQPLFPDDLEINLVNLGQNPTEIFTVVIAEVDDTVDGFPVQTYEIPNSNSFLIPNDDPVDIVSATPIFLDLADPLGIPPTTTLEYEIKVISSLGTIETSTVVCDEFTCGPPPGAPTGPSSITAQLFLDGPNGVNSKTSTIIMFVTNNGSQDLTGVTPLFGLGPGCDDMWLGNVGVNEIDNVDPCVLTPAPPVNLISGQSAFFKWDGAIFGEVDDTAIFCNQAQGTDEDLNVITTGQVCDDLTVINPNDCGGAVCEGGGDGGATIILIDDLLTRPSLFMIIPSPFGDEAANEGLGSVWGVNLVNPTEVDMTISKLTIVVYPPTANDADTILTKDSGPNNCIITAINPTTNWSCPKDNTLLWQTLDPLEYVDLPARSAVEMLVNVEAGSTAANTDIDALIVQANVFTTLGSFGKGEGYQSTMRNDAISLVNVFLQTTDTVAPIVPTVADRTDFHGINTFTITEYEKEDFYVSLADMDDDDATIIDAGARFIVNVPREWTEVCILDDTGFVIDMDGDPTPCVDERVVEIGDGSTQITVFTDADLGGPTGVEADVAMLHFEARPPCNDIATVDQPYIMYLLADGKATYDPLGVSEEFPIGPLNEVGLVVDYDPGLDRTTCDPPQANP